MAARISESPIEGADPIVREMLVRAAAGELCCLSCRAGCGVTDYAARICPNCAGAVELRPASGRGRIYSHSIFHTRYNPELPPPYTVLLVELEEGPRLAVVFDEKGGAPPKVGDAVAFSGATGGIVRFALLK